MASPDDPQTGTASASALPTGALPTGTPLPDWRGAEPPPATAMRGNWCEVAPLDLAADGSALYAAYADAAEPRDWTYLPYGPFDSEAAFIDWLGAASAAGDPFFHTIRGRGGTALGLASYLRIDPAPGVIEVGHIHYSPLMQRSPVATEAMYLMMRRVFDELGYRRYEWKCDALNARSRAAALRLGFSFEGVFRQATVVKQRNRDTAWFAIIDRDWPTMRDAFEAWLRADNFDAAGAQRARLGTPGRD